MANQISKLDTEKKKTFEINHSSPNERRIHCPLPTLTSTNTATTIYEVDGP